jgi:hypothetical protein
MKILAIRDAQKNLSRWLTVPARDLWVNREVAAPKFKRKHPFQSL